MITWIQVCSNTCWAENLLLGSVDRREWMSRRTANDVESKIGERREKTESPRMILLKRISSSSSTLNYTYQYMV